VGRPSRRARRSLPHFTDDSPDLSSDQAKYNCQIYANNDNVTCYPTAGDQVFQHQWAAVVCKSWCVPLRRCTNPLPGNSKRPQIVQNNSVNIYLFNADSLQLLFSTEGYPNPTGSAGEFTLPVNDSWFGDKGSTWQPSSGNFSYPFYWVITNGNGLDGSQTTNPTFFAIRMSGPCTECLGS